MNVFLGFYDGDGHSAVNLLKWLSESGGLDGVELRLVVDPETDFNIWTAARCMGCSRETLVLDSHVKGWIPGSNALWLLAAKRAAALGAPWIFLEPDAVPIKHTWAKEIAAAYAEGRKPYMGAIVTHDTPNLPNPYMEGCAVYPPEAYAELKGLVTDNRSWTLSTAGFVVPRATNSPLFQHLWGEKNRPPTFARQGIPGTHVFGLNYIRPATVLFHRSKDGTLIDLLRERKGLRTAPVKPGRQPVIIRRTEAIGDVLCASVVCEKLIGMGYPVEYQSAPAIHCVMRRHCQGIPACSVTGSFHVNLDGAYESDPNRKNKHFHEMFWEVAQKQLRPAGIELGKPLNCTPRIQATPDRSRLTGKGPHVVIIPKSNGWLNRTVPDAIWREASKQIEGTCYWGGTTPGPGGVMDLGIRHLDTLIETIAGADLVVTVDTGPMHIAAALNIPMVVINQSSFAEQHLSDQNDFFTVAPGLSCLNCQLARCPIDSLRPPCMDVDPRMIAAAINKRISRPFVSCIVAVYKPPGRQLNKCLAAVLPQVDEIIVCRDQAGIFPERALTDPKIRYVVLPKNDVGYGRKVNYAARQSAGEWLWMLNDDCYVAPGTIGKLRDCIQPQVGMISHELRYPNGLIQHGGTYRNPGDIGWGHLDHNSSESRIKMPVEMENVTGASVLIRRKAFYQANGFDEEFYLYCEDNAMCLQLRRAGWKIVYTPRASAIHDEHSSTNITPNLHSIMCASHAVLKRKWGWYFEHNRNRAMGTFV